MSLYLASRQTANQGRIWRQQLYRRRSQYKCRQKPLQEGATKGTPSFIKAEVKVFPSPAFSRIQRRTAGWQPIESNPCSPREGLEGVCWEKRHTFAAHHFGLALRFFLLNKPSSSGGPRAAAAEFSAGGRPPKKEFVCSDRLQ